jgi:maltooligosyltrehalose trehalohydrolase
VGRAKIAAALEMTAPFVPMIFQGEEWAASTPFQYFTDHEAELGKLISEGRKREFAAFGWDPAEVPDPQARATYERSKLDWSERDVGVHAEMLAWYRELIALRKSLPELMDGEMSAVQVRFSEAEQWLVMVRGAVTVAFSLAKAPVAVEVRAGSVVRLASEAGVATKAQGALLKLPPDSVAVLTT